MTMTYKYRSPLRPLDIGYVAQVAEVEIDWDETDIGPSGRDALDDKTRVYAFKGPLPDSMIEQMTLEFVGN